MKNSTKGNRSEKGYEGGAQSSYEHVTHTFGPVFDEHSEILILGSLPSVKSREQQFYYGHPRNRFWSVLAAVYQEKLPCSIEEKRAFLLRSHVAVWDVIAACDIIGSSDSSIRNVVPNDLRPVLDRTAVKKICLNGGKAYELFCKYCKLPGAEQPGRGPFEIVKLPSTSPANAAWSLERLTDAWRRVLPGAGNTDGFG